MRHLLFVKNIHLAYTYIHIKTDFFALLNLTVGNPFFLNYKLSDNIHICMYRYV